MHFIIDGYNVIRTLPKYKKIRIKEEKKTLLDFLNKHPLIKKSKHKTTVVFDGYNNYENVLRCPGAKIVFSENKSADYLIKLLLENSKNTRDTRVVTDDREIRDFAKIMGAKPISVREFAASIITNKALPDNKLDPAEEKKVTDELMDLWED